MPSKKQRDKAKKAAKIQKGYESSRQKDLKTKKEKDDNDFKKWLHFGSGPPPEDHYYSRCTTQFSNMDRIGNRQNDNRWNQANKKVTQGKRLQQKHKDKYEDERKAKLYIKLAIIAIQSVYRGYRQRKEYQRSTKSS